MELKLISRFMAAIIVGILLGIYSHRQAVKKKEAGREAFLADQATYWERNYAKPHYLAVLIVVSLLLSALIFGVYELLAAGFHLILKMATGSDHPDPRPPIIPQR